MADLAQYRQEIASLPGRFTVKEAFSHCRQKWPEEMAFSRTQNAIRQMAAAGQLERLYPGNPGARREQVYWVPNADTKES